MNFKGSLHLYYALVMEQSLVVSVFIFFSPHNPMQNGAAVLRVRQLQRGSRAGAEEAS